MYDEDTIEDQLKKDIIEKLNIEGIRPEDIDDNAPLFGEALGLDSIDALELLGMLENKYKVKVESPEDGKSILYSIASISKHIKQLVVK